ncbi:MAG: carbohydrate ABC transporter permease [Chloroflexi bacterium]|nr:carbohydrate ABC transporter permease [Chloroflexota bacterium]
MSVSTIARGGFLASRRRKQQVSHAVTYLLLTIFGLTFAFPLYWMVATSLKTPPQQIAVPPIWIPHSLVWQNYPKALTAYPYADYLRNTLTICILNVIGTVVSSSLVAYGFSRIRWPGRNAVFILVLATLMLPYQVTMIPLFLIFRGIGWVNTFRPLIVPSFFGNAFFIFLLRQFFMLQPAELSDAARIDGCTEFGIFYRIILPLARPALATVALFQFMNSWNDFLGPLIYLNSQRKFTLALGLQQFVSAYGSSWGQMMAAAATFTVPMILLFFFTQRTFIQGIALTGLKG